MNKIKQWLKSKTIWWNTVGMPATIAMMQLAIENFSLVREYLGVTYGVTLFILIMTSNYLRSITTKALDKK